MRKENYFIAMVNRKVVPLTITLPVLGECVLLSRLLEFCLFRIIFTALFNKQEKHLRVEVLGNDSGYVFISSCPRSLSDLQWRYSVDVDRRRIVQEYVVRTLMPPVLPVLQCYTFPIVLCASRVQR